MSIIIRRLVPTGGALAEAVALLSRGSSPDPVNVDFSRWYASPRDGHATGLTNRIAIPADEIEALLAEDIPQTPSGRAWVTEIRAALERTRSDAWRPFDLVRVVDDPRIDALDALTERLANLSPMTEVLAAGVNSLIDPRHPSIAAYRAAADRITDTGFVLSRGADDENGVAQCPEDFVRWEHAEALVPGFRDEVTSLFSAVLADIPVPAEDDATARIGLSPRERGERAKRASA